MYINIINSSSHIYKFLKIYYSKWWQWLKSLRIKELKEEKIKGRKVSF